MESEPVESTRGPAVVIATKSGDFLAPIERLSTSKSSRLGHAANSSAMTSEALKPSFVNASELNAL